MRHMKGGEGPGQNRPFIYEIFTAEFTKTRPKARLRRPGALRGAVSDFGRPLRLVKRCWRTEKHSGDIWASS